MSRKTSVELTNMCMIYNDKKEVLVQDKIGTTAWSGLTFPGGHIENNESIVDSVIREVYEETGLIIEQPMLCGIKDWIMEDGCRYIVLLYKTNLYSGEIHSSKEGIIKWMPLEEMLKGKMVEDMDKMIEVILNDKISELYYTKEDIWIPLFK